MGAARSVVVAEEPGHQRDTQLVLFQSEYRRALHDEKIRFVDLNRDELIRTPLCPRPGIPPRDASNRAANYQVRDNREQGTDNQHLYRVKPTMNNDLVDHIQERRKDKNLANVLPSVAQ